MGHLREVRFEAVGTDAAAGVGEVVGDGGAEEARHRGALVEEGRVGGRHEGVEVVVQPEDVEVLDLRWGVGEGWG